MLQGHPIPYGCIGRSSAGSPVSRCPIARHRGRGYVFSAGDVSSTSGYQEGGQNQRPQVHDPSYSSSSSSSGSSSTNTSTDRPQWEENARLNPRMFAAMALSPLAALSLPLVQNEKWVASAREFGDSMRQKTQDRLAGEEHRSWASDLDSNLTFMDWTFKYTGIDLSYIWDPELWVKFKEAVSLEQPQIFWNAFAQRIEYKNRIPQAGLAGDMRISYSKFLQLLEGNRVKRVVVFGDMKTAIVEVPHPWYANVSGAPGAYPFVEDQLGNPISLLVPNPAAPNDPLQWYCPEMPEWNMEKYRFYVDLPGDFWEGGVLLRYLRSRDVQVEWDAASGQYILPHKAFTKMFEVKTEVQILDPKESWDFLSWLTTGDKVEFYEKSAAVCLFFRGLSLVLDWSTGTPVFRMWSKRKKKKKSKEEKTWDKLTRSTAREFMSKDAKTGKKRDTGVRFADIAGLDHIIFEMREVVKMLLNDPAYVKVGAKVPRGIIFMGPPGTGKTYMARAIAGEAGVPFFSSVGSEFVEMFAGVAAARVNNLFLTARKKAPAIIFIDELDAIGRARSMSGSDPGSMERESALLAMLVQMDGIHGKLESVLTIGATNLAGELDGALLRPGRFEAVYEIPAPGPVGRMEILRYHSRNKQLDSDSLLSKVAEITQGWSAASLANLMNEAAILTVRRNVSAISLPMIVELVEGIDWGSRAGKIPPGEAKNRLAMITAAKAVAFAVTPGMEKIRSVTLWSRKKGLGPSISFLPAEKSLDPMVHPEMMEIFDWATNTKVNASTVGDQRLGEFLHVASMLVPLYTPRAAEVGYYGPEAASLATAAPISDCFQIGYWCVRNSQVHPRFRSMPPLHTFIWLGEGPDGRNDKDPLAVGLDEELGYHSLTLTLLKASWRRAQRLVAERRSAIERVAKEMLSAPDELITGERLVELIESTPLDDATAVLGPPDSTDFLPILKEVLGKVPGIMIDGVALAPTLDFSTTTATIDTTTDTNMDTMVETAPATAVGDAAPPAAAAPGELLEAAPEAALEEPETSSTSSSSSSSPAELPEAQQGTAENEMGASSSSSSSEAAVSEMEDSKTSQGTGRVEVVTQEEGQPKKDLRSHPLASTSMGVTSFSKGVGAATFLRPDPPPPSEAISSSPSTPPRAPPSSSSSFSLETPLPTTGTTSSVAPAESVAVLPGAVLPSRVGSTGSRGPLHGATFSSSSSIPVPAPSPGDLSPKADSSSAPPSTSSSSAPSPPPPQVTESEMKGDKTVKEVESSPNAVSSSTTSSSSSSFSTPPSPEVKSASPQPPAVTEIRLTSDDLITVSKAIMGRLDIVDLVGSNTAEEIAERVRDALLDPETIQRFKAVREFVEQEKASFPPPPLSKDVPLPIYGQMSGTLENWKQRQITEVSWSAIEMLYTPSQLKHYRKDADTPRDEDEAGTANAAGQRDGSMDIDVDIDNVSTKEKK